MNIGGHNKLVHQLSCHHKTRLTNFLNLKTIESADILLFLTRHVQYQVLSQLSNQQVAEVINYLDPDDATDLIQL